MTDTGMGPTALLGGHLRGIGPDGAVKLARELCCQLDSDPDSFHGGIWPGNVDLDVEGKAVLGRPDQTPAARRPADQVEYTAPEFFWNGTTSAAGDVYAVGLLLYAGCSGGFLPFQPHREELTALERASALRRRMKGEPVPAPEGISDGLKKVIGKALAYDPEARYITASELLSALGRTDEALPVPAAVAAAPAAAPAPETKAETPAPEAEAVINTEPGPEKAPEAAAQAAPVLEKEAEAGTEAAVKAPSPAPAKRAAKPAPAEAAPARRASAPAGTAKRAASERPVRRAGTTAAGIGAAAAAAGAASVAKGAERAKGAKGASDAQPHAPQHAAGGVPSGSHSGGQAAVRRTAVQKDLEGASRARRTASVVPAAQRKEKRSRAVPILCGAAALAILGAAGWFYLSARGSDPQISQPFSLLASRDAGNTAEPASTDGVASPEPSDVPAATATPRPAQTPEPAITPDPAPSPTPGSPFNNALPGGTVTSGTSGTSTGTAGNTGASTGTGTTPGTGSSTGTGTTPGTGSSTGAGSAAGYGTGVNTGAGAWTGGTSGGGTSAPTYTVHPASGTVYLTGNQVRVRTGPGTGYAIVGAVSRGDSLPRTGTVSNGWTQVTYMGASRYVSSQYLTDAAPTAAPTATPAPSASAAPTPTPSASPAPAYTAVKGDLTYEKAAEAAGSAGLACAGGDRFDAVTQALADAGADYFWLGAEYDGTAWKWADGTVLEKDDPHWAAGCPKDTDKHLLLGRSESGAWQFLSVPADFDPSAEPYQGRLGYVIPSAP